MIYISNQVRDWLAFPFFFSPPNGRGEVIWRRNLCLFSVISCELISIPLFSILSKDPKDVPPPPPQPPVTDVALTVYGTKMNVQLVWEAKQKGIGHGELLPSVCRRPPSLPQCMCEEELSGRVNGRKRWTGGPIIPAGRLLAAGGWSWSSSLGTRRKKNTVSRTVRCLWSAVSPRRREEQEIIAFNGSLTPSCWTQDALNAENKHPKFFQGLCIFEGFL